MLILPLGTQSSLPWSAMPVMVNGVYVPLLALSFVPGPPVTGSVAVGFSYATLDVFIFSAVWTSVLVWSNYARQSNVG
jgi:hypothetical protein